MLRRAVMLLGICTLGYAREPTPVDERLLELEIRALPPRHVAPEFLTGVSDLKRKALKLSEATRFSHRGSLADLISFAFEAPRTRISGPDWISTSGYDIYFETRQRVRDIRPVLRDILKEKFALDVIRPDLPTRTLVLKTPTGQPHLPLSKHLACTVEDGDFGGTAVQTMTPASDPSASLRVFFRGCGMGDLARELSSRLLVRVINEASAMGRYDFAVSIGMTRPFNHEISSTDVEHWSDQAVRVLATELRAILGVELSTESRAVASLVVTTAKQLHGTLHIKSAP